MSQRHDAHVARLHCTVLIVLFLPLFLLLSSSACYQVCVQRSQSKAKAKARHVSQAIAFASFMSVDTHVSSLWRMEKFRCNGEGVTVSTATWAVGSR